MALPSTDAASFEPAHRDWAGFWSWLLQRASGLLLVYFVGVHLVVLHFLRTGPIDATTVAGRLQGSGFMLGFYAVFVMVVTFHAANGIRGVVLDYTISPRAASIAHALTAIVAASVTVFGFLVLASLWKLS